jgi:hypothetical protein
MAGERPHRGLELVGGLNRFAILTGQVGMIHLTEKHLFRRDCLSCSVNALLSALVQSAG